MKRVLAGVTAAAVAVLSLAGPARAETLLWTLVASPLAVTTGQDTTFTLTATNEDPLALLDSSREIGCVVVDLPANFSVAAATVAASNAGASWSASVVGNRVRVRAGSGGDRLELLDWVRFTVRATPTSVGSIAWASRAFRQTDCSGTGTVVNLAPLVVVSGAAVSPSPTPTPVPTSTPTPTPMPSPSPRVTPSQAPTASPRPSDDATASATSVPTPIPADGASATSAPSPTPPGRGPSADGGSSPAPPRADAGGQPPNGHEPESAGGPPGADRSLRIPASATDESLAGISTAVLLGAGVTWVIPAGVVGVPGLLILLWVTAQALGAGVMTSVVRRWARDGQP